MKQAELLVTYNFSIECPYCGKRFDVSDDENFLKAIFNNRWEAVEGEVENCPHCDKDIIISGATT
jgi:endogenous inhibitor of DNA gyrase (YacG/DUF329 family)